MKNGGNRGVPLQKKWILVVGSNNIRWQGHRWFGNFVAEQHFVGAYFRRIVFVVRGVLLFFFGQPFHHLAFPITVQLRRSLIHTKVPRNEILVHLVLGNHQPFAEGLSQHQEHKYGNKDKLHLGCEYL
jgi:hypothetical protein